MNTSDYQLLKIHILDWLGLSRDAVHMHIGLAVFFLAVLLWKRGRPTTLCLVPVLVAALGMEAFDLRDDYATFGYFRWSASAHDVVNTMFWPVLIVLGYRWVQSRS